MQICNGMNLREAIRVARDLGIAVEDVRRTGEIRFRARGMAPVVQNARRKDATRAVVRLLRRVADEKRLS